MNAVEVEQIIDRCLQRLENGEGLEEILASYPGQADELRPLLETALDLDRYAASLIVPQNAQSRSRAQFLTAAAGMQPVQGKWRVNFLHLRLATSTLIAVAILVAVLLGTGFASADALPGDVFYPVKLMVEQMQINMVQDPPARLEMEENYDDRRMEEVVRLSQLQRRTLVTFSGFLQQTGAGEWQIGTLLLQFPADIPNPAKYKDAYVEVTGYSDTQVVDVVKISLRQLQWDGVLQSFTDNTWVIGGVMIGIDAGTNITGAQPQVGAEVEVVAVRMNGGSYQALNLNVKRMANVLRTEIEPGDQAGQATWMPSGTPDDGQEPSTSPVVKNTPTGESHCSGDDCEKATSQPTQKSTQATKTGDGEGQRPRATSTPQPNPTSTRRSEDGEKSHNTPTATAAPTGKGSPTPTPSQDQQPTSTATRSHDD